MSVFDSDLYLKYLNSIIISPEENTIVEKCNHCLLRHCETLSPFTKLSRESILKPLRPMYKY